jgi:NodT family efflux transporter outer membrane factor (OMF) lipoprotein
MAQPNVARELRRVALAGGALLLASCTVGPNYKPPTTPIAAAGGFREAANAPVTAGGQEPGSAGTALGTAADRTTPPGPSGTAIGSGAGAAGGPADAAAPGGVLAGGPEGPWWRLFRDPVLDGLVADALATNADVRVAVANLDQARGLLAQARSARLPTTTLGSQYSFGRSSIFTAPGSGFLSGGTERSFFSESFSVGYELDLFGRVRRLNEAARGDIGAQAALVDAARATVAADVAQAYAQACSAAEQRAVALRTLDLLQRGYDLTQRTFDAGRGTRLDLERYRALVEQQRATVPQFEASQAAAIYALARLTGRAPADLPAMAGACTATPQLDRPVPVGDGAALLRRRPDVRAAERQLAANTARIGVETAALYPQISLGAAIGAQALSFTGLFNSNALNYSVGPLLSFSFPNQALARGRIRAAQGAAAASLGRFDAAVLAALQETETAINALGREVDRSRALAAARDAAQKAAELSRTRNREGLDSFLTVLDSDRTLVQAEAALAQSRAQVAQNQVALFRALGGGWEGVPLPSVRAPFDGSAEGRARAEPPGGQSTATRM